MQNSPIESDEAQQGLGAQKKPFTFSNVTSSSTKTNPNQPTFQNPFKKSSAPPNTLFGMNINVSQTPSMFGGLPKALPSTSTAFSAKSPPTSFFSKPVLSTQKEIGPQKESFMLGQANPTPEAPKEQTVTTTSTVNKIPETSDSPKATPPKICISTKHPLLILLTNFLFNEYFH